MVTRPFVIRKMCYFSARLTMTLTNQKGHRNLVHFPTFRYFSPEISYAMAQLCAPSCSFLASTLSESNSKTFFTYPYVAIGSFLRPHHQKLSQTHDTEKPFSSGIHLFTSIFRLSPQQNGQFKDCMIDNSGQKSRTTGRWYLWWSQEFQDPISSSRTSRSTPQIQPSASLCCQRSPLAVPE